MKQLDRCFEAMENNPFDLNIKPLSGEFKGLHRIRLGNLRVVIAIYKENKTIHVLAILPSGDVYKK